MPRDRSKRKKSLAELYPPSEPCGCAVCLAYCSRPGWWTVAEAARALEAGLGPRMMLELAPERTFSVLSPAFKGNEGIYALNQFKDRGCNFLKEDRCELHGTGLQPLECRFCHHERVGQGPVCHTDLEKDWNTPAGQELVMRWKRMMGKKF